VKSAGDYCLGKLFYSLSSAVNTNGSSDTVSNSPRHKDTEFAKHVNMNKLSLSQVLREGTGVTHPL